MFNYRVYFITEDERILSADVTSTERELGGQYDGRRAAVVLAAWRKVRAGNASLLSARLIGIDKL